jgi:hypothetical protein
MRHHLDLRTALPPTPEHYIANLQHTLDNLEDLSMKKRHSISLAVTVLVSVLMISVALAATNFGILDFFHYTDEQGTHDAAKLENYVQTIGKTHEGNQTLLTVQDAICDKALLAIAWTMEKQQDDMPLYLDWQLSINGGETELDGGGGFPNGYFWENGEPVQAAVSYNLNPILNENEPVVVDMTFHILKPAAEIAAYNGVNALMTEDEMQAYQQNLNDDARNMKFVLEYGEAVLPQDMMQKDETIPDALVRLGLASEVDSYHVSFTLAVDSAVQNLLPDGQSVTRTFDGYTAVITQAELTPLQLTYSLECRFASEQDAAAFDERDISYIPLFDNDTSRFAEGSESQSRPYANADGTWTILYECSYSSVYANPETITIVPESLTSGKPEYLNKEALTLMAR